MKNVFCALCLNLPFAACAAVEDHIEVLVSGRITDSTCEVALAKKTKTVLMGTHLTQNFDRVNDTSAPVSFTVNLENCGQDTKEVRVAFTGTSVVGNNSLLALNSGSVSQLAIRILDNQNNPLALNDSENGGRLYKLEPTQRTQILRFSAQYVALSVPVDTGEADATAKLSLTWP